MATNNISPTVREFKKMSDLIASIPHYMKKFFEMDQQLRNQEGEAAKIPPHYVQTEIMRDFMLYAKPRWIVGQKGSEFDGQLGFRIFGMNFWYYKWNDPQPVPDSNVPWREAEKREFGECINSKLNPKNISSATDE